MSTSKETKRLGDLLLVKGLLSQQQLDDALQEQGVTKEFLGTLLVRKGWLSEDAMLETLAEQFGIPYVHLEEEPVDWAIAKRFSPSLLADHDCFPLRMDAQSVTVAIANPLDAWAISELQKEAGFRKVQLVLASAQAIRTAIRRAHQAAMKSLEALFEDPDHGDR